MLIIKQNTHCSVPLLLLLLLSEPHCAFAAVHLEAIQRNAFMTKHALPLG